MCVCRVKKALSAGQLFEFLDLVHPVLDCIEQLSKRELVHSRIVSLYSVARFLMALVTGQEVPAGVQWPWLPDEISKAKSFLACFESREEALPDWVRQRRDALA